MSNNGMVTEEPMTAQPIKGPCSRCGARAVKEKRDRLLFYLCLFLFWPAIPFLPKKPYCVRCNEERWK